MNKTITIDIDRMEHYLNTFWLNHSVMTCPTDKHNYFKTTELIFKILKDFEVKK